jgi:hypothetical protein
VVVDSGATMSVPPAGDRLSLLPSVPVRVTVVAFAAVTVSVEDPPALIDAGLAVMLTVGPVAPRTVRLIVV